MDGTLCSSSFTNNASVACKDINLDSASDVLALAMCSSLKNANKKVFQVISSIIREIQWTIQIHCICNHSLRKNLVHNTTYYRIMCSLSNVEITSFRESRNPIGISVGWFSNNFSVKLLCKKCHASNLQKKVSFKLFRFSVKKRFQIK